MAEFVRAIIQKEKINWYHRNAELDALAVEFGLIRKELNAIGRNINQITKAFHHTDSPAYRSYGGSQSINSTVGAFFMYEHHSGGANN